MDSALPRSIQRLIEHGIKLVSPRAVYLYGSRARGDAAEDSDFDLAFDFSAEKRGAWLRLPADYNTEPPTLREVDLADLNGAPPELRTRILKEGKRIYG